MVSWWDEQAGTLEGAQAAVWSEDGADQEQRAADCLALVEPALGLRSGQLVLDLACGIGRLAVPLARRRQDVTVIGYDTSAAMLRWAEATPDLPGNVAWQHGGPIPWVDAAFSVVTFQHLDPETVDGYLGELHGALTGGGRFRFQFVVGDHHEGLDHRYGDEEMVGRVEAAGFHVESLEKGLLYQEWAWITAVRP